MSPDAVVAWAEALDAPPELVVMEGSGHFFHRRLMDLRGLIKTRSPTTCLEPFRLAVPATSSTPGPSERYAALVESGRLQPDPAQRALAESLQGCFEALRAEQPRWFRRPRPVPGLYIHGSVGRGKTC